MREQHGYLSLPLLARPNSIVPVGASETRPDYPYAEGVTFHVFELTDMASARVPAPDGSVAPDAASATVEVRREGDRIDVQVQGASASWSVLLRGIENVASVTGGTAQQDALGTRVVPDAGVQAVAVQLAEDGS